MIDITDKLYKRWEALNEAQKLEFSREIKEKWSGAIVDVYRESVRVLTEEIALLCEPHELIEYRKSLKNFQDFERLMNRFINFNQNYVEEKIKKENPLDNI